MNRSFNIRHVAGAVFLLVWAWSTTSQAQSTWELTPYRMRVWWIVGSGPELPATWRTDFPKELDNRLQAVFRAICERHVEQAPESLQVAMARGIGTVNTDELLAAAADVKQDDKVFLVAVAVARNGYQLSIREFDGQTMYWGPTVDATVSGLPLVTHRVVQLIAAAFSPVLRIERTSGDVARTQLRAGTLIRDPNAPGTLQAGEILLPFDRRISNTGVVRPQDVRPVDWTYLVAEASDSTGVPCQIVSGFKQPFRSKQTRRLQQLAVRARPVQTTSRIRLQSRSTKPEPLIGYELHATTSTERTRLVGRTDWQGEVEIAQNEQPVQILLIRSGDRVMAKLPIVPGLRDVVVASIADDSQRVAAEGFLSGIQTALIDLVARRESLTAQVRRHIRDRDFEMAERLIEKIRVLPSQGDFQREIQQQQQVLSITDDRLRRRVDTLFVDTDKTLGRYLDASRVRQLTAELAAARGAGS